jgi:hypothetical protein
VRAPDRSATRALLQRSLDSGPRRRHARRRHGAGCCTDLPGRRVLPRGERARARMATLPKERIHLQEARRPGNRPGLVIVCIQGHGRRRARRLIRADRLAASAKSPVPSCRCCRPRLASMMLDAACQARHRRRPDYCRGCSREPSLVPGLVRWGRAVSQSSSLFQTRRPDRP